MPDRGEVHHRGWLIAVILVIIIVAVVAYGALTWNISALPEPGRFETRIASGARNWYVGRAAAHESGKVPASDASAISAGEGIFGMACAQCHGKDGRNPTNIGKSMYPRVPDLGSPDVQEMSDRELFWVVKNGIRLSGMPGFANILSDEDIWRTTFYLRSLGKQPKH